MDENRARDAQSSTASGQSCSVPSGSGPGRGGGGADSIVPANVIAIMWWGKMAGWPAFDGSILPSIDPKNTARLFCAPSNCCWGEEGKFVGKTRSGLLRKFFSFRGRKMRKRRASNDEDRGGKVRNRGEIAKFENC